MTDEEIDKLSKLCRIACTQEEKQRLREQLSRILEYVDQLKKIDTTGIPPCNTVLPNVSSVMREDEIEGILSRDLFLANAPQHIGGLVRVPPVIQFE
jgi:aspartyl-tRNA(Asn)/glutamyl-tRNA(Gln) amidotransferase subunit C